MKSWLFLISVIFATSCQREPEPSRMHLIGIEVNGADVPIEMLREEIIPSRIYSYYVRGSNRIKDGQEYVFTSKSEFQIFEYVDGNVVNSYWCPSSP